MVKFQRVRQIAKIVLNSDDAVRETNLNHVVPFRDEPVRFDPTTNAIIDVSANRFNVLDHRLFQGERVVYTAGTTAIGGLTSTVAYYVIYNNPNQFQLASDPANAQAGTPIDINSTGAGTQIFTNTRAFDAGVAQYVDVATSILKFDDHEFRTGDMVRYVAATTPIGGLVSNKKYFVVALDENSLQLADSFEDANATPAVIVRFTALGAGGNHQIRKELSFDSGGTPVIDFANKVIHIPAHEFKTGDMVLYQVDTQGYAAGTAIGGLLDNMYYYVINHDTDAIRLADSRANALAGTHINITGLGTGSNHTLTKMSVFDPVPVCTNYRFKLDTVPMNLNSKCRLAVQSFDYIKNYNTNSTRGIGAVYIKSLPPTDIYSSQGYYKGSLLLNGNFANSFSYQNTDYEYNSLPVPENMSQILQNSIDIFVDTKKKDIGNDDIEGCINDDQFNICLAVYEFDDFEYVTNDLNEKTKNFNNPRFV